MEGGQCVIPQIVMLILVNMHNLTKKNAYSVMLMSIPIFYANYTSTFEISSNAYMHVYAAMADDLYVIEVLVAELDVVGGVWLT